MKELLIHLRCPACGHTWLATRVVIGAWWAPKYPETEARFQCFCPACNAEPPMDLERTDEIVTESIDADRT